MSNAIDHLDWAEMGDGLWQAREDGVIVTACKRLTADEFIVSLEPGSTEVVRGDLSAAKARAAKMLQERHQGAHLLNFAVLAVASSGGSEHAMKMYASALVEHGSALAPEVADALTRYGQRLAEQALRVELARTRLELEMRRATEVEHSFNALQWAGRELCLRCGKGADQRVAFGVGALVLVDQEPQVDERYQGLWPATVFKNGKPDRASILEALKRGEQLPGCSLLPRRVSIR